MKLSELSTTLSDRDIKTCHALLHSNWCNVPFYHQGHRYEKDHVNTETNKITATDSSIFELNTVSIIGSDNELFKRFKSELSIIPFINKEKEICSRYEVQEELLVSGLTEADFIDNYAGYSLLMHKETSTHIIIIQKEELTRFIVTISNLSLEFDSVDAAISLLLDWAISECDFK